MKIGTKRIKRSDLRKYNRELIEAYDQRCVVCGSPLTHSWEKDHRIMWSLTHDDSLENLMPVCGICHPHKDVIFAPPFLTSANLAKIQWLRRWWHSEKEQVRVLLLLHQCSCLADRLQSQPYAAFIQYCEGYSLVSDFFNHEVLPHLHLGNDEAQLAFARILLFLAPIYDRRMMTNEAEWSLLKVIEISSRLFGNTNQVWPDNARSELAHCYIKQGILFPQLRSTSLEKAKNILRGHWGPAPKDDILNNMQYHFASRNFEAVCSTWKNVERRLTPSDLVIAHEITSSALLGSIENMKLRGYVPHYRVQATIEDVREHDRCAFYLAIRSAIPRDIFLRSLNLVRSSREAQDWSSAAQAIQFARMFRYGSTGVESQRLACLDSDYAVEPQVLQQDAYILSRPRRPRTYEYLRRCCE